MLTHTELKKGVKIIIDGEPFEILESQPLKMAQRRPVIQTKIRSLFSGVVFPKNFQQGDVFEEAEMEKVETKFIYAHREKYFFTEKSNPSHRFELDEKQIGEGIKFLKPGQEVEALKFQEKIINISLPIKVQLKVTESPPGVRGDRAQGGTKQVTLETGAQINVPLFVEEEDVIEVNTETGLYLRRVE